MGIWASLSALVGARPSYRPGYVNLGIGVNNMGMEQPGRAVDGDFYSRRYNVRGGFALTAPNVQTVTQFVPENDLRYGALYMVGDIKLAGLVQEQQ